MSAQSNKYENGKIYKISSSTEYIYIGSTIKSIQDRLKAHKIHFNSYKNGKNHYITSFEIIQYDDCQIELLENYPTENNEILRLREDYYIKLYPNAINKYGAYQTKEERKKYQNQYCHDYNKKYFELNKDKINEKRKLKITCDKCGVTFRKSDNARHNKTINHLNYVLNNIKSP
jgi:hypothetical protein